MSTGNQQNLRPSGDLRPRDFAAWLLDLDGTLYRQRPVRLMMACELVFRGRRDVRLLREFRREHERLHLEELLDTANPFEVQLQRAANRCGIDPTLAAETINRWMIERPGKWLQRFRRKTLIDQISQYRLQGGRTAVVSDYPARKKLAAMGIDSLFDVVIASGEPDGPNRLKPNPAGLLMAAEKLQIAPSDCLVIGDRWDVDGAAAQNAGMRFLHVASRWPS